MVYSALARICLTGVDWEWMGFSVKNPLIKIDLLVVSHKKVQIFERFSQKKGLHHVFGTKVQRITYIAYCGVSVKDLCILFDSLKKIWFENHNTYDICSLPGKCSIPNPDMFCCQSRSTDTKGFR